MRFPPLHIVSFGTCAIGLAAICASWSPEAGWQRAGYAALEEGVSAQALMAYASDASVQRHGRVIITQISQPEPRLAKVLSQLPPPAAAPTPEDELPSFQFASLGLAPDTGDMLVPETSGSPSLIERAAALFGLPPRKPQIDTDTALSAVLHEDDGQPAPRPSPRPANADAVAALARGLSDVEPGDRMIERAVEVGRGDTLMKLLVGEAVPKDEAIEAIDALRKHYNPRSLKPGQKFSVLFENAEQGAARPIFVGLRIDPDYDQRVEVSRMDDGGFIAKLLERPLQSVPQWAMARVNSSLMDAGKEAGVPAAVLVEMIRAFSYDVDFQRDLQPGDRFLVEYDQSMTDDGQMVRAGELRYAALIVSGRKLEVFRFEHDDGTIEFYNAEGKSVRKALLRTPVEGARMSSGYGMREHPILGYSKMHRGVDFAAPNGTPIYAAGDGTIERAGRYSSYGNYIRVRHPGSMATAYAHLSKIARGIKPGTKVSQGQLIGYVGATGRATGPHLHYEVLVNGSQVNPMSISVSTGTALAGVELDKFRDMTDELRNKAQQVASRRGFGIQLAQIRD
jgi:murein DD-endopeptidase MepM/ murein hydrolase activator NlpD